MSNRLFCAIPARGGSKRFPRKNLALLRGKPMLAYSIEAALDSKLFDKVYVCTDDDEIAYVARKYGARVPQLSPPDQCGDLVASHVPCQQLAHSLGADGPDDALVCLQPTSPLRSAEDVVNGVRQFQSGSYDFCVSVTPIDPHYFHWAVVQDGQYWRMWFGKEFMKERPLLPSVFRPNGSIKIARFPALHDVGNFFGERLTTIETPEERSVHVTVPFELEICERLLERR